MALAKDLDMEGYICSVAEKGIFTVPEGLTVEGSDVEGRPRILRIVLESGEAVWMLREG